MVSSIASLPLDFMHVRGDELSAEFDDSTLLAAADDLRAFSGLLLEQPRLRRTLSNSGVPDDLRVQLLTDLVGEEMTELGLVLCSNTVRRRFRTPAQMLDYVEAGSSWLFLVVAQKQDALGEVEEELFRFWRVLVAEPTLIQALENQNVPVERRAELLRSLLLEQAHPVTVRLLEMSLSRPGTTAFLPTVERLLYLAAEVEARRIAFVTAAAPLTEEEMLRMASDIENETGFEVDVKVSVDPSILGGVIIRVGDMMIDGSVRRRLDEARRQLGRTR